MTSSITPSIPVSKLFLCVWESLSVVSDSFQPHGLEPARLLCTWNSPGQNTGVGSHSLLRGIFPTQGLNQGLEHCMQILYGQSHQGSPQFSQFSRSVVSDSATP